MEQEALDIGRWIRNWSVTFILFGSLLEIGCFYLYNGVFHPFANILQDPSKDTCKDRQVFMNVSTKSNCFFLDSLTEDIWTLPVKMKNIVFGSIPEEYTDPQEDHDVVSSLALKKKSEIFVGKSDDMAKMILGVIAIASLLIMIVVLFIHGPSAYIKGAYISVY